MSLHEKYGPDAPRVLGGMMTDAAEKNELPERFRVTQQPGNPSVFIIDTTTMRTTIVPLFAYGAVRKTLNDLFGGNQQ
jgi:hypothetical protein